MPCYEPDAKDLAAWAREEKLRTQYEERLNKLTRLMCEIMHDYEYAQRRGVFPKPSQELATWWEQHKKFDKKRKKSRGIKR